MADDKRSGGGKKGKGDESRTPPPVEAADRPSRVTPPADSRLSQDPGGVDSPWPSSRPRLPEAADSRPSVVPPIPAPAPTGAAWGEPFARLDARWTALEAHLCTWVLATEIVALCLWVTLKGLSAVPAGGDTSGLVLRALLGAVVLGAGAHFALRPRKLGDREERRHTIGVAAGIAVGLVASIFWVGAGASYFSNFLNWMQNASTLMLVGGLRGVATRLTLWLALLGASIATAKGKHINVDVVMRFLQPRQRVPVALVGWFAAGVMCLAAVWGFLDHIAIEDFKAQKDLAPGKKIERIADEMQRDLFLFGRQASLDLRSTPRVLAGTKYDRWLTGADYNEWFRGADWKAHFPAEDLEGQLTPEAELKEPRAPAVNWPGGGENIRGLLVRDFNLIFPFGLLMIGLRFLLRCLLTLSGHVKVDPDAAHDDEGVHKKHAEDDAAIAAVSGGAP